MINLHKSTSLFLLLLFGILQYGYSQAGFTISRFNQNIPDLETIVFQNNTTNQDLLPNGYRLAGDFWIKPLKDYRLELYPEFSIGYAKDEFVRDARTEEFQLASAGVNLNMNFYVLNFHSDCDCPTFSKPESFFEKGFFIQVSPGYHYFRGVYEVTDGRELRKNVMNELVPKLGLGAGIDIGISDLITITPIVQYSRFFNAHWDQLSFTVSGDPLIDTTPDESHINQFSYGLHIGIRWRK